MPSPVRATLCEVWGEDVDMRLIAKGDHVENALEAAGFPVGAAVVVVGEGEWEALLKASQDLLQVCGLIGTFDNGVWHGGQCEGEVIAGQRMDALRSALTALSLPAAASAEGAVDA